MDDEDFITKSPWDEASQPRRVRPYDILLRQSRKMGGAATRTLDFTKGFLASDIETISHKALIRFKRSRDKDGSLVTGEDKHSSLRRVAAKSHEILAYARGVILPVNLFPDTIAVDRTKVTIEKRSFFWSSQIISIRIEDVLNVAANLGPLFGSVTVSSRVMNSTDHYEVSYLWRNDAAELKQIIQGYVIALHNGIDIAELSKQELLETLREVGTDH